MCLCIFFATTKAQGGISIDGNTVITSDCLAAGGSKTYTLITPFDPSEFSSITWKAFGGIDLPAGSTGTSVAVASKNGTAYTTRYSRYAKGRLIVTCEFDSLVDTTCNRYKASLTYTLDIYKSFDLPDGEYNNAIIGPECIYAGDSVTYSVAPWVSIYEPNRTGFDSYYWNIPEGLYEGSHLYYSADSSSVAFVVGNVVSEQRISVKIGQCNNSATSDSLWLDLHQGAADPIFNKDLNNYCLPIGVQSDTIIVTNPQTDTHYYWDFRSWEVKDMSVNGDTVIYVPGRNEQVVRLHVAGCTDKWFIYDINRSVSPNDSIRTNYGYCVPANTNVVFHTDSTTAGTLMAWKVVEGAESGWSISNPQSFQPTVHTGTGTGVISAKTAYCGGDSIVATFYIQPATPSTISGATCLAQGDQTEVTYSIDSVANANSYQWDLPQGWEIKTGTSDNGTSIVVIPSGTNGGTLKVRAVGCSTSSWRALVINLLPETPSEITLSQDCINIGLGDTITLSAISEAITGSQTFHWVIPTEFGSIISATSDSAQITVSTTGAEDDFIVSVQAYSSCGTSSFVYDTISLHSAFVLTVTEVVPGVYYLVSINNAPPTGSTIQWYINGEEDVAMQGYTYHMVNTVSDGTIGNIAAKVTYPNTCITQKVYSWGNTQFAQRASQENANFKLEDVFVFPNPAKNTVTIQMPNSEEYKVFLVSMDGQTVINQTAKASVVNMNVTSIPKGNYVIVIMQDDKKYSNKLIIE
ncbi:MAG: T9SS type A sorting domain-containing protein, partial [Prevotellaceae bacterium]|jgi:hypothetical protein|nr:T9SS type A sorting domain-containing protein [Prevotellaceae bacterium]